MSDRTNRSEDDGEGRSAWVASGRYAGLGLQLAASIGFFLWLGWMADDRLGTTPLFTIVGAFLGFAGGFYSLYRQLVLDPRRGDEDVKGKEGEG